MVSRRDFFRIGISAVAMFSAFPFRARTANSTIFGGKTATSVDIESHVRKIVADKFSVDPSKITLKTNFVDDLGADYPHVELIMAFEDEFNIDICDEDAEMIKTVGDAVEYLKYRFIESIVRPIVADHLSANSSKITPKTRLHDDLGADSLETIELAMAFEDEFGLDIPDEDVEMIGTVGDWIKYLMDKLKERL